MHRTGLLACVALMMAACQPAASEEVSGPPPATPTTTDAAPASGGAAFTPADMTALIEANGAAATLQTMLGSDVDPRWETFIAGLSRGDQAWIDVVAPLKDDLDGEGAESVYTALSEGLAFNAAGVLRAGGNDYTEMLCWNEAQPGADAATRARNAARMAAVEAIPEDGDMAAQRMECLTWLTDEPT